MSAEDQHFRGWAACSACRHAESFSGRLVCGYADSPLCRLTVDGEDACEHFLVRARGCQD